MKKIILLNYLKKNYPQLALILVIFLGSVFLGETEVKETNSTKDIKYENATSETDVSYSVKNNDLALIDNYRLARIKEQEQELVNLRERLERLESGKVENKEPLINSDSLRNVISGVKKSITQEEQTVVESNNVSPSRISPKKVKNERTKIINFPVTYQKPNFNQSIPKGSYMRAIMMNGIESKSGGLEPVLLSIEGKTIMPNNFFANLKNCVALGKAQGEESNERVCIQIHDIVCLDKNGKSIEQKVNGFITDDKDNTNCAIGKVNTKQNSAVYSSAIANIIKSASSIVASAATSTITTPLGGIIESTKNQKNKIIASGISGGADTLAEWYLKRANTLMPTINVGSGREVWIVTLDSFEIPKSFLKETY